MESFEGWNSTCRGKCGCCADKDCGIAALSRRALDVEKKMASERQSGRTSTNKLWICGFFKAYLLDFLYLLGYFLGSAVNVEEERCDQISVETV